MAIQISGNSCNYWRVISVSIDAKRTVATIRANGYLSKEEYDKLQEPKEMYVVSFGKDNVPFFPELESTIVSAENALINHIDKFKNGTII